MYIQYENDVPNTGTISISPITSVNGVLVTLIIYKKLYANGNDILEKFLINIIILIL